MPRLKLSTDMAIAVSIIVSVRKPYYFGKSGKNVITKSCILRLFYRKALFRFEKWELKVDFSYQNPVFLPVRAYLSHTLVKKCLFFRFLCCSFEELFFARPYIAGNKQVEMMTEQKNRRCCLKSLFKRKERKESANASSTQSKGAKFISPTLFRIMTVIGNCYGHARKVYIADTVPPCELWLRRTYVCGFFAFKGWKINNVCRFWCWRHHMFIEKRCCVSIRPLRGRTAEVHIFSINIWPLRGLELYICYKFFIFHA
jgi:hypothetical protein